MRSLIVPFFNYDPAFPTTANLLYNFFQLHFKKWEQYIGEANFIRNNDSHWANMNRGIREAKGDYILLMDSDMIIYKPEVIDENFKRLERDEAEIVSIIDSSGHKGLWGEEKRRLAPYLCFLKKSILPPDFDFTPVGGDNWYDSMGYISEQLKDKRIYELPDDRSNIYNEADEYGNFKHEQWMNDNTIPENPDYGYYHIRNFGQGLKMFNRGIDPAIPPREAYRLLAWACIVAGWKAPHHQLDGAYYEAFKNYYPWLKNV